MHTKNIKRSRPKTATATAAAHQQQQQQQQQHQQQRQGQQQRQEWEALRDLPSNVIAQSSGLSSSPASALFMQQQHTCNHEWQPYYQRFLADCQNRQHRDWSRTQCHLRMRPQQLSAGLRHLLAIHMQAHWQRDFESNSGTHFATGHLFLPTRNGSAAQAA